MSGSTKEPNTGAVTPTGSSSSVSTGSAQSDQDIRQAGIVDETKEDIVKTKELLTPSADHEKRLIERGHKELSLRMLTKACQSGDLKSVQLVFEETPDIDLSTLKSDEDNTTPLHIASREGHRDVVQYLLKRNLSPLADDRNKNTPLHLAASNGHSGAAFDILEYTSNQNRDASESARFNVFHHLNEEGRSPLGCALLDGPHLSVAKEFLTYAEGKPEIAFPDFSKTIFPKFESRSLNKPVSLFFLGDHDVGKSTIICSMQEDSNLLSALTNRRKIEETDKHFTGIVMTDFSNASFQRVVFYDLAGHTNYFNEKLFDSTDDIANSAFVVMVNLEDDRPKTFERLVYWMNLLHYYVLRSGCTLKPNTLIVGSHLDMRKSFWRSGERLLQIFNDLVEKRPKLAACFDFVMKPVSVDCRKLASFEIRNLRSSLHKICQRIRPVCTTMPSSMCHILSAALKDPKFQNQPVLSLGELASKISECSSSQELNLIKLLPQEPDQLLSLCKTLHENQRVLLFENPASTDVQSTWIVHDSRRLLTEIDRQLKSLNSSVEGASEEEATKKSSFRETFLANSGIISLEALETALTSQDLNLDSNLAVQLLQRFKYCEAVFTSGTELRNQYFFLPSLLGEIGKPDPWEGDGFGFAWCLTPAKDQEGVFEFFLPRYLKKLLLSLIQRFVQNPTHFSEEDDRSSESSAIERSEVGNRAISWLTTEGINITIFTNDDSIVLNMYCSQPGTELSCLQLRNYILSMIREQQEEWQPEIKTTEFLIPFGEWFPVRKPEHYQCRISLNEIQQAMVRGQQDCDGVPVQSLVFHDPCIVLSRLEKSTQKLLLDSEKMSTEVSQEVLSEIALFLSKKESSFYSMLHLPDIGLTRSPSPVGSDQGSEEMLEITIEMKSEPKSGCSTPRHQNFVHTYEELLRHFDSFSICKSINFLRELQERNQASSAQQVDTENVFHDEEERDRVLERQISGSASILRSRSSNPEFVIVDRVGKKDLPFVNSITTFSCTNEGLTINSEPHGIMIKIPPNSLPKGVTSVEIEFGVLLTGPFEAPPDIRIVSPILWFGTTSKAIKFNKYVEITIPHCIEFSPSDENKNLAFYKSTQNETFSDIPFAFALSKDQARFAGFNGIISTKHPSFLCICHKVPKEMVLRSRYSIISVVPKEDDIVDNNFTIRIFVTPALRTCFEMVNRMFPGYSLARKNFKFKSPVEGSEAAIEINYDSCLPNGWMAALKCFSKEILLTEVNILNTMDDMSEYPPSFTIEVLGDRASRSEILHVSFSGATRPLSSEHFLKLTGVPQSFRLSSRQSSISALSLTIALIPPFLTRHLATLVQLLDMDQISPHLSQLGVLTPDEQSTLLLIRRQVGMVRGVTGNTVIQELVSMLCGKGVECFGKFMNALEMTTDGTGHGDIVKKFKEDPDYDQIIHYTA